MSIPEVSPEQLAKLFHHYWQVLAPDFGCGDNASTPLWQHVPPQERSRLIAAARLALTELTTSSREQEEKGRYFARPGEAEWGC